MQMSFTFYTYNFLFAWNEKRPAAFYIQNAMDKCNIHVQLQTIHIHITNQKSKHTNALLFIPHILEE